MFFWLIRPFLPSIRRIQVDEAIFGFSDIDLDSLAAKLSTTLDIQFYTYHSPILGDWQSTIPSCSGENRRKKMTKSDAKKPSFVIMQNIIGPRGTGNCDYLLMVTALSHEIISIQQKLGNSGLNFRKIRRHR